MFWVDGRNANPVTTFGRWLAPVVGALLCGAAGILAVWHERWTPLAACPRMMNLTAAVPRYARIITQDRLLPEQVAWSAAFIKDHWGEQRIFTIAASLRQYAERVAHDRRRSAYSICRCEARILRGISQGNGCAPIRSPPSRG